MKNDIISVGQPESKVIDTNIASPSGDIMQFTSWRVVKVSITLHVVSLDLREFWLLLGIGKWFLPKLKSKL